MIVFLAFARKHKDNNSWVIVVRKARHNYIVLLQIISTMQNIWRIQGCCTVVLEAQNACCAWLIEYWGRKVLIIVQNNMLY